MHLRLVAQIDQTRHAIAMTTAYFLPAAANNIDLSPWSSILPGTVRVLRTNLFGDAFVVDIAGAVHMLERGACTSQWIAATESAFWDAVETDDEGWQLRPLVDDCRRAGMFLVDGQCYAFTTPPVLGGEYVVANVWVAPWQEWFGFTADLFQQIKDIPNGASVSIKLAD